MTFDELLDQACTAAHLPDMAKMQLPSALSERTKKRVMKLSPEEFGDILSRAINKVNRGSIESIDALVREQVSR